MESTARPHRRLIWLIAATLAVGNLTGCVRRRMTVRSNPPGALVYVDKREIGFTPVSVPFVRYGTREFQLLKDGHETLTVKQRVAPPWYQVPPLDFFSENLWPWEIRDERVVDFQMLPQRNVPNQELRGRGEELRQRTRQGMVIPPIPRDAGPSGSTGFPSRPGTGPALPTPTGPPSYTIPREGIPLPDTQPNNLPPPELMQQFVPR